MTRVIKFRAWDGKKMHILNHFQLRHDREDLKMVAGDDPLRCRKGGGYTVRWPLMQYTGIKDKNGQEIYEGDALYHDFHQLILIVGWDEDRAGFYFNGDYAFIDIDSVHLTVVGNVHETPEVMEPTNANG